MNAADKSLYEGGRPAGGCPDAALPLEGALSPNKSLYEGGRPAGGCPDAALPLEGALSPNKSLYEGGGSMRLCRWRGR